MLRDHHVFWRTSFILVDVAVTVCAFLASYWIRFLPHIVGQGSMSLYGLGFLDDYLHPSDPVPPFEAYVRLVPALALVVWISNSYFRLYQPRRTGSVFDEVIAVVKSNLTALLLLLAVFFFDRHFSWSRSVFVIFAVLNPFALILFRVTVRSSLRILRAHGYNLRRVLVVGTGRTAQELITRFESKPWTGIVVEGVVSLSEERVGGRLHGVPIIASVDRVVSALRQTHPDQVYIALTGAEREAIEGLVEEFSSRFIPVRIVPDVGYYLAPRQLADFDGLPVVSVWDSAATGWDGILKRGLDMTIATVGVIACAPLFLLIGSVVKLTSPGPVLYTQKRMGLDGRLFDILKFRTMRVDADDTAWTREDDERCTAVGRFLRRTSLDELPQLFNVIAGQMSLVGPRPERPMHIEQFRKRFPQYMLRHRVKAGMTGWAQVNGWRGNTSLRKRLQYDMYYMRNWSIWFDIKIIFLTFLRGLVHPNAY